MRLLLCMHKIAFFLSIGLAAQPAAPLTLRKTEVTTQVVGEKGVEASIVVEASRGGKKLYTFRVEGVNGRVFDGHLFVVERGLEDVLWWSI